MNFFTKILRFIPETRFKILGLATIKDIPTEKFNAIIEDFLSDGWRKTYEYSGIDAWIDYGCVKIKKGNVKFKLEWDNWTGGSIEGNKKDIESISLKQKFPVTQEWRWKECNK